MPLGTTFDVVKTGLYELLRARPEFDGVQVEDGYPNPAYIEPEGVVLGDVEGTENTATMRAAAGTRDEVYEVEVVTWKRVRDDDRRSARVRAIELGDVVAVVVYEVSSQPLSVFPGVQVRQLVLRSKRLQEIPYDNGREAQYILRVEVRARLSP